MKLQKTVLCTAMYAGLTGLAAPGTGLSLYGCCRLPYTSSTSSVRSIFDRLPTTQFAPCSFLRMPPPAGFGAGLECSPTDGLTAGGFGLDLMSVAAKTPGLGVRPIPPTLPLCPTPHYAITVTGSVASAPADVALSCNENKAAAAAGCTDHWMPAKSSSIVELRLKAQQYAAMLDMR